MTRLPSVILDIETTAVPDADQYIEPIAAPANYKDLDKIASYIKEKRQSEIDNCALDVDLAQVAAIGLVIEGEQKVFMLPDCGNSESDLLKLFWNEIKNTGDIIGFNLIGFDLPMLMRRSLYLGVKPSRHLPIEKYRHPEIVYLMQELTYFGMLRMRGLSFYARRFGYKGPQVIEGREMSKAIAEGRWDAVETHLRDDLAKTLLLAQKLGHV